MSISAGVIKARVFESALGLTADDVEQSRDALLAVIQSDEAIATLADEFGQRCVVNFVIGNHLSASECPEHLDHPDS